MSWSGCGKICVGILLAACLAKSPALWEAVIWGALLVWIGIGWNAIQNWWSTRAQLAVVPRSVQDEALGFLTAAEVPEPEVTLNGWNGERTETIPETEVEIDGPKQFIASGLTSSKRTKYVGSLLQEIRMEFGLLQDSPANRLVVRRYARDKMREHGVRPSHGADMLPGVIELAFVPSDGEIRAKQFAASDVALAQRDLYEENWVTQGFRGIRWGWFRSPFRTAVFWDKDSRQTEAEKLGAKNWFGPTKGSQKKTPVSA